MYGSANSVSYMVESRQGTQCNYPNTIILYTTLCYGFAQNWGRWVWPLSSSLNRANLGQFWIRDIGRKLMPNATPPTHKWVPWFKFTYRHRMKRRKLVGWELRQFSTPWHNGGSVEEQMRLSLQPIGTSITLKRENSNVGENWTWLAINKRYCH